jgi:hypothetical protein
MTLEEPSWEYRVQAMMLPALRLASRREINSKTLVSASMEDEVLRQELRYTNEELTQRPPGAAVPPARNNAQWTIVHLQRAKLLEKVRREAYTITDRGRDYLAKNPAKITFDDLRQFEEYRQLRKAKVITPAGEVEVAVPDEDDESEENLPSKADAFPQVAIAGEPEVRQSIHLQAEIAEIGAKMGFRIWVPVADRAKVLEIVQPAQRDSFLEILPLNYDENTLDTIRQIDVLWLKGRSMARAFEVEHTTAIYSGILRMADLLALQPNMQIRLHIVAPDERRDKVIREIKRPVFSLLENGPLYKKCTFLSYDSIHAISKEKFLGHMSDSILGEYEEHADQE